MMTRRELIKTGGAALVSWAVGAGTAGTARAGENTGKLKKAVQLGMIQEKLSLMDKFKLAKELGFDGVELNSPDANDKDELKKACEATGLGISEVVDSLHWKETLSSPNPDVRARGVEALKTALEDAKRFGASSVLLVPAVVNKNVNYADAYKRSQEEIRKVIPFAQEQGVKIAVENVWNQFLLSPLEMARYVDEFESPWVGVHFDVGNVVNYGWPEQWIRILGKRILKLHIKEYSRARRDKEGLWKGFEVKLGDGDCDWPAVVKALGEIGYNGWATAEVPGGDRTVLQDISARMDKCLGLN